MLGTDLYYETDGYSIITKEQDYLRIVWKKQVVSEQIRRGLQEALEMMKMNGIKHLISDTIQCDSSWTSSNEWIASFWLPQARQQGLRKVAFIASDSIAQKVSIENLKVKLQKKYRFLNRSFQVFQQEHQALEWLQSS
jgi:hypothetical protein